MGSLVLSIIGICISILAVVLPLAINNRYRKRDKQDSLDSRLDSIIKIGIQYPYLEDKSFTKQWSKHKDDQDEKYLRYDNYCNIVFNFLHSVCENYEYDREKVENYIDIKNWMRTHEDNWRNPVENYENVDGYDEQFRKFINSYLN